MIKRILLFFIAVFVGNVSSALSNVDEQKESVVNTETKNTKLLQDRLQPTNNMRAETICIVRCLEELHYQHKDISELNNEEILTEYFSSLDTNRMYFVQSELDEYLKRFAVTLDIFIGGGSLTPAFTIFENYRKNVNERVTWVIERLNKSFDFSSSETYTPDRTKVEWPVNTLSADALWENRLKYELLNELLTEADDKNKNKLNINTPGPVSVTNDVAAVEKKSETTSEVEGSAVTDKETEAKEVDTDLFIKENKDKNQYEEAVAHLIKRYKNFNKFVNEFDSWFVEELFLNSITRLYDPHSSFMSKETYDDFEVMMKNSLVGIGALLMYKDDYCIVEQVYDGSPAAKSKQIKHGDKILEVAQGEDGEFVDIVGIPLNKSVKLIRGDKGTIVRLKIQPADGDPSDRKVVSLVRDLVPIFAKRAHANIFNIKTEESSHKIGLIVLPSSFYGPNEEEPNSDLTSDTKELIAKLKQEKVEGIILDLRNNGGGLVDQAIGLTSLFLNECTVFMSKNSFGVVQSFPDNVGKEEWDGRLIVLTSMNSASATEIFAGALRDYKRAMIVGTPKTHGKGSVQTLLPINKFFNSCVNAEMGAAKITTQKWYFPKGNSAQLKGVESDIQLESYDMFVPYHEKDLPHALDSDSIAPAKSDIEAVISKLKYPVTEELIQALKSFSESRKNTLDEFKAQKEDLDRFKSNIEQKEFSLNLEKRKEKKELDNSIKLATKTKFNELKISSDFESTKIELDAVIAKKEQSQEKDLSQDDEDSDYTADSKSYNVKDFDVNLRETLRIMVDWINFDHLKESRTITNTFNEINPK